MRKLNKEQGITLVALVITIIILLILAGITINQLTENGLLEKTKLAKEESVKSRIKEEIQLELMDIIIEYNSKGTEITNSVIKEGLEKGLEEIEVLEDLTGTYKGYEYEIDEDFNVSIIDNNKNDFMNISMDKKIGTSYIIINVEASSMQGKINQYEYIIDGKIYISDKTEHKIESLEPESIHTIKVRAIDEKGNRIISNKESVKTEQRTYLYNEGNEYEELTGGWTGKNIGYYSGYGSYERGTDYLYVKNTSTNTSGNSNYWPAWITNNKIDLTQFCKVVYEGEFKGYNDYGVAWNPIVCAGVPGGDYELKYFTTNNKEIKTSIELTLDDVNKTKNYYVAMSAQNSHGDVHSEVTIRKVWLEK